MHSPDLFETEVHGRAKHVEASINNAENSYSTSCFNRAEGSNTAQQSAIEKFKTESIWVTVSSREQLHLRHFFPNPELKNNDTNTVLEGSGRAVFMLHGEAECGRIFYGAEQRGLAWYLVKQGYEVFVADLGNRGRSLVLDGEISALSVNEIVTDAIPKLLHAVATQRLNKLNKGPEIWVAHGFGAVLLAAAWSRMDQNLKTATQMIFLAARRRIKPEILLAKAFAKIFSLPLIHKSLQLKGYFPSKQFAIGTANENLSWYESYAKWLSTEQWEDLSDGYDYHQGLSRSPLPPVLHIAPRQSTFFSSPADIRLFVEELGPHNARLVFVDQKNTDLSCYNHISMLLDHEAEADIFDDACTWLASADEFDQVMQMDEGCRAEFESNESFAAYNGSEEADLLGTGLFNRPNTELIDKCTAENKECLLA